MVIGFEFVMALLALLVVGSFTRSGIKSIPPYQEAVYLRMGKFVRVLGPGTNFVAPWVNKLIKFDKRIQSLDIPRQEILLEDNRSVYVNATVFIRIVDTRSVFMDVEDYCVATVDSAKTAICSVIGHMGLEDILSNRLEINSRLSLILDEFTKKWGVAVEKAAIREVFFAFKVTDPVDA